MTDEHQDVDEQLELLEQRIHDLRQKCLTRTSMRLTRELKRQAKQERRVVPYLTANFYLTNAAQDTFEVEVGIEAAIDAIALLESEERARQFQPDFPEDAYYYTVHWMSACAYDNLATHVARRDGYNSDGVHDGINDGIEVCRRTGKLECVACFREYASSVFHAAGDLEMALHHARTTAFRPEEEDTNKRRWAATSDMIRLFAVSGKLAEAIETAVRALHLIPSYHNQIHARLKTQLQLEEVLWLAGRQDEFEKICAEADWPLDRSLFPPPDESPELDLLRANRDAVAACCRGEPQRGIEILAEWDQRLTRLQCLSQWFDVRLRLIAMHQLAGESEKAQRLAKPLAPKARPAHDWLTLSRLKGLLEQTVHPSPLAFAQPAVVGPFAPPQPGPSAQPQPTAGPESATDGNQQATADEPADVTPLTPKFEHWQERVEQAQGDESVLAAILNEILAFEPSTVTDPDDAGRLIHMATYMASVAERLTEAWRWAEPFGELFSQCGTTLNVLANVASAVRNVSGDDADQIVSQERVESLFRTSLDLDPDKPRNFARAGFFFLDIDKAGEAERCFARSFQLDRTQGVVAVNLAEIYEGSDRSRDALAVLDLCIREGCRDPQVLWPAGLTALDVGQYETSLSYLDEFEAAQPGEGWTYYYRALNLLELGRAEEAQAALDIENQRSGDDQLHVQVLYAWADSQLGRVESFRERLVQILDTPLVGVDYLTTNGLIRLFEKLYHAAKCLPAEAPEKEQLRQRLLESGLAPDSLFADARDGGEVIEGVNYYACITCQPLDDRWASSPGCLFGQDDWTEYVTRWGALARDEDEAERMVLDVQARCYHLPAELLDCELQDEGYSDAPGIVWQSLREPAPT